MESTWMNRVWRNIETRTNPRFSSLFRIGPGGFECISIFLQARFIRVDSIDDVDASVGQLLQATAQLGIYFCRQLAVGQMKVLKEFVLVFRFFKVPHAILE